LPDRHLDRGIIAVRPIEPERLRGMERRLREETRHGSAMLLRGVHQERMAEIDVASFAGRQCLRPLQRSGEFTKFGVRHSLLAGGFEQPCDLQVRSHLDAGRSIAFSRVGE
jgi:hypothetical protein